MSRLLSEGEKNVILECCGKIFQNRYVIGSFAAMFIIFRKITDSPFVHPVEAMMGMFMMSLGEFSDYIENFEKTDHPFLSKVNLSYCESLFVCLSLLKLVLNFCGLLMLDFNIQSVFCLFNFFFFILLKRYFRCFCL